MIIRSDLCSAGIVPAGRPRKISESPGKPDPGFEALFIPDAYHRVAMIVPQLAYHDITGIRLLGTSGWDSPELLKTNPELFEGAVFVDGFFSDSFRSEAGNFTEAFYLAYGREPETMEALVYDAAHMAVQLLIEERGQNWETFRDALAQVKDFPGVTGRTTFPPSRDAQKELFVLTVRDNQIIQVK
jgi:ABC-type branched-subunit amino acid transport system substrate-binding protein